MHIGTPSATRWIVTGGTTIALLLTVTTLFVLPATLHGIFSQDFLPHSFCYLNDVSLIRLHVGSDAVIWLSYVSISCTLVYLVWRTRREIPFSWMFLAFGTFIVACGFTHFMEVVVLWKPVYWLAGDIKLLTALASIVTAIALPGLVPQIHQLVASAQVSEQRKQQLEAANSELHQLSAQVLSVQDTERRRIARELHDGVGQYMTAIKMSCEVALRQSSGSPNVIGALQDALSILDRCTSEVRTMSHLLHPPLLEEMGLKTAIPWYLEGFEQRSGVEVILDMPTNLRRLPEAVELVLFRVLQESLTNIHRHSGSKVAEVRFELSDEQVSLEIRDHGRGFSSAEGQNRTGVGIASMRERVREIGGSFSMESKRTGTTVQVVIPLQEKANFPSGS